jgi:hypothetical protein
MYVIKFLKMRLALILYRARSSCQGISFVGTPRAAGVLRVGGFFAEERNRSPSRKTQVGAGVHHAHDAPSSPNEVLLRVRRVMSLYRSRVHPSFARGKGMARSRQNPRAQRNRGEHQACACPTFHHATPRVAYLPSVRSGTRLLLS